MEKCHEQIKPEQSCICFVFFIINTLCPIIDISHSSRPLQNCYPCTWVQPPMPAHILVADRKQEILVPLKIAIVGPKMRLTQRRVFYFFICQLVCSGLTVLASISNLSRSKHADVRSHVKLHPLSREENVPTQNRDETGCTNLQSLSIFTIMSTRDTQQT